MLYRQIVSTALVALLACAEVGAVSVDVNDSLVKSADAPLKSTLVLDQAPMTSQREMGVLVIPIDQNVALFGTAEESAASDSVTSLGFARVPLPAAAWLFGTAVVGIIAIGRRRPNHNMD